MSEGASRQGRSLRKRTPIDYAEGSSKGSARDTTLRSQRIYKERGRTRVLSGLMYVPVDIFLEIASQLHPLDLLHVARASKQLRSILLSRRSRFVWRASLRGVDAALPTCPDDMSEPAYAALLFDQVCTLCSASPARWADYAIRLRLCKSCHNTHIRKGKEIIAEAPLVSEEHARLAMAMVPCEIGKHPLDAGYQGDPRNHAGFMSYYVPQLMAALSAPVRARRKEEFFDDYVSDLCANSKRLHQYATAVLQWKRGVDQREQQAKEDFKARRKAIIVEKLVSLGYEESDMPDNPEWSNLVEQTKELTERIWINLLPKLEPLLQEEKERKTREAYRGRVQQRLEQLSGYYNEWVKDVPEDERGLMPNTHDGARLPCLLALAQADDAQGDLSPEDFHPLSHQVLIEAKAYLTHAKEIAVMMLQDGIHEMPDYDVWYAELETLSADDAPLSRHYALFECEERYDVCNTGIVTFEELHAHWRTAHPQTAWGTAGPPQLHVAPGTPAKLLTRIRCRGSYRVGGEMLDAVRLSRDSPRAVLDELVKSARLYCACGDPSMPPPGELDWLKLYSHVSDYIDKFQRRIDDLPKTPDPKFVLKSNHLLTGLGSCIRLLSKRAKTAPAFARIAVDGETRARIEARLASRPKPEAIALCRSCRTLTARSRLKHGSVVRELTLPSTPEGIVYHLRGWHEKDFEDRDIVWDTRYAL